MELLKHIPEDSTYNSHEQIIKTLERGSKFFDCVDLSNFTDFLPATLQEVIIAKLFGERVSDSWMTIMKEPLSFKEKLIIYTKGQPMGLLSS